MGNKAKVKIIKSADMAYFEDQLNKVVESLIREGYENIDTNYTVSNETDEYSYPVHNALVIGYLPNVREPEVCEPLLGVSEYVCNKCYNTIDGGPKNYCPNCGIKLHK